MSAKKKLGRKFSKGHNNSNSNWMGSGLKTVKSQQSSNTIACTGQTGQQINQTTATTLHNLQFYCPISGGMFTGLSSNTTKKVRKNPTRTDLLVWSQNRNYKSRMLYRLENFLRYFTSHSGKITPGTGLNANKNINASYGLFTKEEDVIFRRIEQDLISIRQKFRERSKELKAQEFGM